MYQLSLGILFLVRIEHESSKTKILKIVSFQIQSFKKATRMDYCDRACAQSNQQY